VKRMKPVFALSAAFLLVACKQAMPPATPVPPAPSVTGYGLLPPRTASARVPGGAVQRFLLDMDVPWQWWTLFHSVELNTLIDEALKANPDIDAAQAALRSARESFFAQRASAYPNAQGAFSVSRQQNPTYYAPPLNTPTNEYVYGVHTASVNVAYTPDVFGSLRYQTATAAAAAEMQRFQTEATYLTLTSNLVAAAVQIASLRDQIDATNRIIAIDRRLLDLTKAQKTYAQASALDVATQELGLQAAEQTLSPLEKQLAQQRDLLARLVGRTPNDAPIAVFTIASLHLPEDLPLSLPSKLIAQRPDIAAASANLTQASAQVGVAYTNRLPNFSITSQTASQALTLGTLFGPGTFLSMLTAEVSTTFYDHGMLKHRQAAAVAAYDEAAAEYKGAVLSGFQNVADTLAAIKTDADALSAAARAERTAEHLLNIVRVQKEVGQVQSLVVLNAEQAYQQAIITRIQAQANRYADTAALFQALGGGWWNRNDS
jgi:NodT family efflux transporter outer membrane factor (OMF) lipoprotein